MKKLITILTFLLIFLTVSGQYANSGWINDNSYPFIIINGLKDTLSTPKYPGAIVYQLSDSTLYIYTSNSWTAFTTGGGGF